MKEESNCFGLIIWIRAARGYTHLLRALSGWRDGEEGVMRKSEESRRLVSRKDLPTSISLQAKNSTNTNIVHNGEPGQQLFWYFSSLFIRAKLTKWASSSNTLIKSSHFHTWELPSTTTSFNWYLQSSIQRPIASTQELLLTEKGHYSFTFLFQVSTGFGKSYKVLVSAVWVKALIEIAAIKFSRMCPGNSLGNCSGLKWH